MMNQLFSLILLLLQTPTPEPNHVRSALDSIGLIISVITALGLIIAIAYFFWHSKNRDELTRALAEATSLANTRGERIKDLEKRIAELESDHQREITKVTGEKQKLELRITNLEEEEEKQAKIEFRLRAEITELENRLGIKS